MTDAYNILSLSGHLTVGGDWFDAWHATIRYLPLWLHNRGTFNRTCAIVKCHTAHGDFSAPESLLHQVLRLLINRVHLSEKLLWIEAKPIVLRVVRHADFAFNLGARLYIFMLKFRLFLALFFDSA